MLAPKARLGKDVARGFKSDEAFLELVLSCVSVDIVDKLTLRVLFSRIIIALLAKPDRSTQRLRSFELNSYTQIVVQIVF